MLPRIINLTNEPEEENNQTTKYDNPLRPIRPFLMWDFFGGVTNRAFFAFKLVIAPQREEIEPALLGVSLTTRGEVPRPFSRFSIVVVARISD